jgi:hypothetical protein
MCGRPLEPSCLIGSLVGFPNEKEVGKKSFVKPIKDDGVLGHASFVGVIAVNDTFASRIRCNYFKGYWKKEDGQEGGTSMTLTGIKNKNLVS